VRRYEAEVLAHARRHALAPSLVLAVIQIESAFNPMAVSPAPAYGLMQLVPSSGGLDAYRFLHGQPKLLDPPALFDPMTNVKLGTAYLKLLDSRYLALVRDPTSRLYCVIAGYNTGAGNVARAFTGGSSVRAAAERINRLSPERVLEHLRARLPFEETRAYLTNVVRAREGYRAWDGAVLSG
jgi:membrane-bound lytic murein transglycosylase C